MATRFEEVQIEKIRANGGNIRSELGDMEQLTSDVKAMGVKTPVIVYAHPTIEGDFLLQEGHRRRQAALAAGLSTLPCIIVDPPKRGKREDIEVMITTGRNHKALTESEINKGVQDLLDLDMDVTTVGKKFKMSRTEVNARAKLTKAPADIQKRFDSGALDLVAVAKIQELEEEGSAGLMDEVIESLDNNRSATARNPQALNSALERAKTVHESKVETARLKALGATEAPYGASWDGSFSRADAALTEEEHLAAGHAFSRGSYDEKTTWFVKQEAPKALPATDAEKAEKQKMRAFNGLLGIAYRARQTFLAEQVRVKDGGAGQDADFDMLFKYVRADIMRLSTEFLGEVTGIGYPEGAEEYGAGRSLHVEWESKVEKRLRTFTWRQIARLAHLFGTKDTDKQLRFAKSFDRRGTNGSYDWRQRANWLRDVQRFFGYELDSAEVEALDWAKDAAGEDRDTEGDVDTVTDACRDCRQSVVGGKGWDGRCGDCIEAAARSAE